MLNRHDIRAITPSDIADATNVPVSRLYLIASNSDLHFQAPALRKTAKGKTRMLDIPKPGMKLLLKKLHRYFKKASLHSPAAHGGVAGRSSFTSAELHLGRRAVVIRDIADCYPNISTKRFHAKLLGLGFRSSTARLLSGLLTCRDRIPQGASTSCDALNLFLWDMDLQVLGYCQQDVSYTRMADDHVLSSDDPVRLEAATCFLEARISEAGLQVNEKKKMEIGLQIAPGRQCVHAVAVNHPTRTRIPRNRQRKYLRYAEKYVRAAKAVSATSLPAVASFRRTLLGYINYSRQAGISSAEHLTRLMHQGDRLVQCRLKSEGVTRSKRWWFANKNVDRSLEFALRWRKMKSMVFTGGVAGRDNESLETPVL